MKKSFWYFTNGSTPVFHSPHGYTATAKRHFKQTFGNASVSHLRVGHFSVVISCGLMFAAEIYPEHNLDDSSLTLEKGSKFWEVSRQDRLRQLSQVESCLEGHPLREQIEADISREKAYLG